jgi:hypothetical protein
MSSSNFLGPNTKKLLSVSVAPLLESIGVKKHQSMAAIFYHRGRKGSRNVHKGASNTFGIRHPLFELCADMGCFTVKNFQGIAAIFFTIEAAKGAAMFTKEPRTHSQYDIPFVNFVPTWGALR